MLTMQPTCDGPRSVVLATGTMGFNMALTLLLACHPLAHRLAAPDGAHQIRVDDVPGIVGSRPGEEGVLGDSCRIDENIDAVLGTAGESDGRRCWAGVPTTRGCGRGETHCLQVGQHGIPALKGTHIECMGSVRGATLVGQAFERLSRGPETSLVPPDQGDGGALGGKELSDGQPYAAAATGHDGACAGKGRRHARGGAEYDAGCVWFYCSRGRGSFHGECDGPRRQ